MSDQPFEVRYVLMCDDMRSEDNGKGIVIGLYNDNINLPQGSEGFKAPLAFVINGKFPSKKPVHVETWIEDPKGERLISTDWGRIAAPEGMDDVSGQIVWRLFPWNSNGLGRFKLHLIQDGVDSVIYEFGISANNLEQNLRLK